jgi:hypothetical protein
VRVVQVKTYKSAVEPLLKLRLFNFFQQTLDKFMRVWAPQTTHVNLIISSARNFGFTRF